MTSFLGHILHLNVVSGSPAVLGLLSEGRTQGFLFLVHVLVREILTSQEGGPLLAVPTLLQDLLLETNLVEFDLARVAPLLFGYQRFDQVYALNLFSELLDHSRRRGL